MKHTPLLSVIIPTYKRSHFLHRAINSALNTAPRTDLEVIIIPNGSDSSWRTIAKQFRHQKNVIWSPIDRANAADARNHGMDISRGRYLRFLDDDDYLLPPALGQLKLIVESGAQVSQGGIDWLDAKGKIIRSQQVQHSHDLISSVLSPDFFSLSHSFLWLANIRKKYPWDNSLSIGDDLVFAMSASTHQELTYQKFNKSVGVWVHHEEKRLSTAIDHDQISLKTADILFNLRDDLHEQGKLTQERSQAICRQLWKISHTRFPFAPTTFSSLQRKILRKFPKSHPDELIFQTRISPLILEWALTPYRFLKHKLLS